MDSLPVELVSGNQHLTNEIEDTPTTRIKFGKVSVQSVQPTCMKHHVYVGPLRKYRHGTSAAHEEFVHAQSASHGLILHSVYF